MSRIKCSLSRLSVLIISLLCTSTFSLGVQAQTETVSKTHYIYFNTGRSSYEAGFRDNAKSLTSAISDIDAAKRSDSEYKVIVTGATSPDGTYSNNTRIAQERTDNIRKLLISELEKKGMSDAVSHISTISLEMGIDWEGLADLTDQVEKSWAEHMSDIFRNYPLFTYDSEGNITGGKKDVAGRYLNGEPYKYLRAHVFQEVSRTTIEIISSASPAQEDKQVTVVIHEPEPEIIEEPQPEPEVVETVVESVIETVVEDPEPEAVITVAMTEPEPEIEPVIQQEIKPEVVYETTSEPEYSVKKCFAIKTNLAFDVATVLNLGIEVPFSRHFSLALEYYRPWWITNQGRGSYCFFGDAMQIEGRFWFPRNRASIYWAQQALNGLFIGAYGGTGKYDIQNLDHGWCGTFWNAGLGLGYSANISKRVNLEFEVGFGIFDTDYQRYTATTHDNILEYKEKRHKQIYYPTRAAVTLVWNLYHKKRIK